MIKKVKSASNAKVWYLTTKVQMYYSYSMVLGRRTLAGALDGGKVYLSGFFGSLAFNV